MAQPSLAQSLEILERTPGVVRMLLRGLSPAWSHAAYGPGTWSAYQVVGHLIAAERLDWLPRLRIILEYGEARPFEPFPHDASMDVDSGIPLDALLDEFARLRSESLAGLEALRLGVADLERTGMHPSLGRVTLGQLLATWAVHDLHHLRQMTLAMAWQYRESVGPWRAYLNTLHR